MRSRSDYEFWKTLNFWNIYQFSSVPQLCLTLCNPMDCSVPSFPAHHKLTELPQTNVHRIMMLSNHLILSCPLLLLPLIFPSLRVFHNVYKFPFATDFYCLWPAKLFCPWNSSGKNIGLVCQALLQGSSSPEDRLHIFYFSCIGRWVLYH